MPSFQDIVCVLTIYFYKETHKIWIVVYSSEHLIPVVIVVSVEVNSTTGSARVHPAILSPQTIIGPSILQEYNYSTVISTAKL